MYLLGVFTVNFIISTFVTCLDWRYGNGFYSSFFETQSLSVMGTIMGLNIATAAYITGHLADIEARLDKGEIFSKTRRELKHNIILMIILFILHFVILVVTPDYSSIQITGLMGQITKFGLLGVHTLLFSIYLYALFEMTKVMFSIRGVFGKEKQSNENAETES